MSAYDALTSDKHRRFVDEYVIDCNGAAAAGRAGYAKGRKATGSDLLARKDIKAAIAEKQAAMAEKAGVTAERVVDELAKLGFSNMLDYIRIGEDGQPYTDFSALTRDQAAAIGEVTVETRTEYETGSGGDREAVPVRKVKFKLADKRSALADLGKHLGLFKDQHEHSGTVTVIIQGDDVGLL